MQNAPISRRVMLRAGATVATALLAPSTRAAQLNAALPSTLVFIRLRGGADGLSLLVPYREPGYYRARPHIAIAPPEQGKDAAVELDEQFALHPCLAAWKPLFQSKELGALVGVGLRSRITSHRQAQRALDVAIMEATGCAAPETLSGNLGECLRELGVSLRPDVARTVLLESVGWDTHVAQGKGTVGRLASTAKELESALLSFRTAAGHCWQQVRVAVVTEFGRTLTESPTSGTDDAYASVLFTFGPRQSGRVRGAYGSLQPGCTHSERSRPPIFDLQSALASFVRDEALL